MTILMWVVLGLVAGFIANLIVDGHGKGIIVNLVLGIAGAFLGGGIMHFVDRSGVTGFNVWSLVVATIGAVVVLSIYHAIAGQRRLRV